MRKFIVTMLMVFATSAACAAPLSTAKLSLNGGASIFELYDDPALIPECKEKNALGAIAKLEKEGVVYPFGTGCWFALANGQVLLRIKNVDTGQTNETLIHNSKFIAQPIQGQLIPEKLDYAGTKKKLNSLGLCNACADNVAQYLTRQPTSKCAILANKALFGNDVALRELQSFPKYCAWHY